MISAVMEGREGRSLGMIEAVPGDLKPSKFTQSVEELLKQDYVSINNTMIHMLNKYVSLNDETDLKAVS